MTDKERIQKLEAKIARQRKALCRLTGQRNAEYDAFIRERGELKKQKEYWHKMYRKVKPLTSVKEQEK